jgi:hypothetical protein
MAWVAVFLVTAACRRHHETPVYEEGPPAAAPVSPEPSPAPPSGVAPGAGAALPRRDDRPRMPDGGTLNGDARGPRAGDLDRITSDAAPRMQACFDQVELPAGDVPVAVHYTVEAVGYTGAIAVKTSAPPAVRECIQGVMAALKFPEFRGPKVELDWSFTYRKQLVTTKQEILDGGTKP